LSLSCAEAAAAAAGAAWLLSDCTDTCAYAPRCLSALAELRKNLLQLPPTAATNSNNYTQRPTKEDAPTRTTKKEKNPNKQTKYINENFFFFFFFFCFLFFVFIFVFFVFAQQQQKTLNCTANNFQ
jgi:ATP-dependent Zn protease